MFSSPSSYFFPFIDGYKPGTIHLLKRDKKELVWTCNKIVDLDERQFTKVNGVWSEKDKSLFIFALAHDNFLFFIERF